MMLATAIRPAVAPDVVGVRAVILDAYGKYIDRLGRPPAPMTADYEQLIAERAVWILELDGEIVGLLVLRPAGDHLLVSNVAVSSRHQGRGLGALLLSFAEEQARQHELRELRLFTNELMHENIAIYRKLGWSEYGRAEQEGFQRVLMRKAVAAAPRA